MKTWRVYLERDLKRQRFSYHEWRSFRKAYAWWAEYRNKTGKRLKLVKRIVKEEIILK